MRAPAVATTSWIAVGLLVCVNASAEPYDPLALPGNEKNTRTEDLTVRDGSRRRDVPLRVYPPGAAGAAPVVLFSHGLGGTREGCAYLGKHWSARGYAAVFAQHPGSDDSVWRSKPLGERMAAMNEAASARNFLLRAEDVPAVLDQLASWNKEEGHVLWGRLDMAHAALPLVLGRSRGAFRTAASR